MDSTNRDTPDAPAPSTTTITGSIQIEMESPAVMQVLANRVNHMNQFFQKSVPNCEFESIDHSASKEEKLATIQRNLAVSRAERLAIAADPAVWDSIFDPFEEGAGPVETVFTPETTEDDLDTLFPPDFYGRPSHASARPVYEPPVLDYRRYEEQTDMYYSLRRHPDSKVEPGKWYEFTDAEIESDLLAEFRDWVADRLLEAREYGDREREEFYSRLRMKLRQTIDQETREYGKRMQARFIEAQRTRYGINVPPSPVLTEDMNPGIFDEEDDMSWDAKRKEFTIYECPSDTDGEGIVETPEEHYKRMLAREAQEEKDRKEEEERDKRPAKAGLPKFVPGQVSDFHQKPPPVKEDSGVNTSSETESTDSSASESACSESGDENEGIKTEVMQQANLEVFGSNSAILASRRMVTSSLPTYPGGRAFHGLFAGGAKKL